MQRPTGKIIEIDENAFLTVKVQYNKDLPLAFKYID
jgi:hypothetical protein